MTRPALAPVASVDDLFRLDPLARFEALIAGPNFDDYLRAEPITFPPDHPIFGTSCGVAGCAGHSTQAEWWCTRHGQARRDALRQGIGEAEWLTSATPYPPRRRPSDGRRPACRFCPERDAAAQSRAQASADAWGEVLTAQQEASWRERTLNAEEEVRRLRQELATQRRMVAELLGQLREPDGTWVAHERERLRRENEQLVVERNNLVRERDDLRRRLDGARAQVSRLNERRVAELFPDGPGPVPR